MVKTPTLKDNVNGNYFADEDFFASDLTFDIPETNGTALVLVQVCMGTKGLLEFTIDGTFYCKFNSNVMLNADSMYQFTIYLIQGEVLNIRSDKAQSLHYCKVLLVWV